MRVRVYYHHTDAGGVVYYGTYLNFLEEARTEFFEQRGLKMNELIRSGILFIVARQEIDYKYPAFYGDILDIETRITEIPGVRINFENTIKNQHGRITTQAKTIMVCVDKGFKPQPIPDNLKEALGFPDPQA